MEIANGFVSTSPESKHYLYGLTPAECVILKKMHNQYSNGSPLSGLTIVGDAMEIDEHGKHKHHVRHYVAARKVEKRVNGKKSIEEFDEPAEEHTPSTKPRTNAEEIFRLKRKYTGNIQKQGGGSSPAFVAAFGEGEVVALPKTFKDIRSIIGDVFTDARPPVETKAPKA